MDFEDTIHKVGAFGLYQIRLTILICFNELLAALHMYSPVYVAYTPDHWCNTPTVAPNSTCTEQQLRTLTMPSEVNDVGEVIYDYCSRYDHNYYELTSSPRCYIANNNSVAIIDCEDWSYDASNIASTVVTEFDLVCGEAHWGSFIAGTYHIAQCFAFLIFGPITDRYGRRITMMIGNTMVVVFGLATIFSPSYNVFVLLRVALAFGISAVQAAGIVILMEHIGSQYRVLVGVVMGFMWAGCPLVLTAIAYTAQRWRTIQVIIVSLNIINLTAAYFFVSESPRWLLVRGKYKQASKLLERVASFNGKEWDKDAKIIIKDAQTESVIRMLMSPRFLYISVVQYYVWFSIGIIYFGIIMNSPSMGDNPYVSFAVSNMSDFPSLLKLLAALHYIGRILPLSIITMGAGVFVLMTIFVEQYWFRLLLVMLSKGLAGSSSVGVWIYSSEVYPTSVRSSSSSLIFIFSRIGMFLGVYVWYLSRIHVHLPVLICGLCGVTAGAIHFTLPETLGHNLTQSVDEGNVFLKNNLFGFCWGKILDGRNRAIKNKEMATNELQCLSVERVIEA